MLQTSCLPVSFPFEVFLFLGGPFYTIAVKGGKPFLFLFFCLFACLLVCLRNSTRLCLGKLIIYSHRFRHGYLPVNVFKTLEHFCGGIILVKSYYAKKQPGSQVPGGNWRSISEPCKRQSQTPLLGKWLITMMIVSPLSVGLFRFQMEVSLTTYKSWEPILQV